PRPPRAARWGNGCAAGMRETATRRAIPVPSRISTWREPRRCCRWWRSCSGSRVDKNVDASFMTPDPLEGERLRRWRLILGSEDVDGTGISLMGADLAMDRALSALYDSDRKGGLDS